MPPLTKDQIRRIVDERDVRHTSECRAHNPRGTKSHFKGCPDGLYPERLSLFGGYHCICDWRERIEANRDALIGTPDE